MFANAFHVPQHELEICEWVANLNSFSPSTIRLWARTLWLASADRRLIFMALKVEMHKWNFRYTMLKLSNWEICEGEDDEEGKKSETLPEPHTIQPQPIEVS